MYIFLPMICSIASETEATSTLRNCAISSASDVDAGFVEDCDCAEPLRPAIAHTELSINNAIPDLRQICFLVCAIFISPEFYTLSRNVTLFSVAAEVVRNKTQHIGFH